MVTEDRNLIFPGRVDKTQKKQREIYYSYYSIDRLRRLFPRKLFTDHTKHDLWESVKVTFRLFEQGDYAEKLGIKPLGAGIFEPGNLGDIVEQSLANGVLLDVTGRLCYFRQSPGKGMVKVNYGDLDVEEFGSVYESLLELHPRIVTGGTGSPRFTFAHGSERKTTGSYYTRHDLVNQLLKSALDPLVEEKLRGPATRQERVDALLYGLECDELRYTLDPPDVHGEDFPGETFRVLKEKEIRKYGEFLTRRLVLEAYDRLRSGWDMESHLEKLKTIWDECQKDLSQPSKPERTIITQTWQVAEPGTGYGGLFDREDE